MSGFLALRENHIQTQWNEYLADYALNLILMRARSSWHGKGDRDAAIARVNFPRLVCSRIPSDTFEGHRAFKS